MTGSFTAYNLFTLNYLLTFWFSTYSIRMLLSEIKGFDFSEKSHYEIHRASYMPDILYILTNISQKNASVI